MSEGSSHGPQVGQNSLLPLLDKSFFYRTSNSFDRISSADSWYQTTHDKHVLRERGSEIVSNFPPDATIIEFGPGDMSKTEIVLGMVDDHNKFSSYVGIDISSTTFEAIPKLSRKFPSANIDGIHSDFKDVYGKLPDNGPRVFVSLGSSLFSSDTPSSELRQLSKIMHPEDIVYISHELVASDSKHMHEMDLAYGSYEFREFPEQPLSEEGWYNRDDWKWDQYCLPKEDFRQRHVFSIEAIRDVPQVDVEKGYRLEFFPSWKFNQQGIEAACTRNGLVIRDVFEAAGSKMLHYLISI